MYFAAILASVVPATDHVAHHRIVLNLMAVETRRAKAVGAEPKARPPRKLQRCRAAFFGCRHRDL
jgi:hypothetical protein